MWNLKQKPISICDERLIKIHYNAKHSKTFDYYQSKQDKVSELEKKKKISGEQTVYESCFRINIFRKSF